MSAAQQDYFNARLERISSGRGADGRPVNSLAEEMKGVVLKTEPLGAMRRKPGGRLRSLVVLILGILLGGLAMLLARLAIFHFGSASPDAHDAVGQGLAMLGDIGTAALIGFVLAVTVGLLTMPRVAVMVAGGAAMYIYEPDLAQRAPTQWAMIYTPRHVERMISSERLDLPNMQYLIASLTNG